LDLSVLAERPAFASFREAQYDRLATHLRAHVDMDAFAERFNLRSA
jgi:hypothetical protein